MENEKLNQQDDLKKQNPEKGKTDLNLEEMGADQYDYGMGGPGAGRDDSSTRSEDSTNKTGDDSSEPGSKFGQA
jgi:hypothetical protein